MSKRRWIYRGGSAVAEFEGDTLVWAVPEYYHAEKHDGYEYLRVNAPMVMPDIQPYKSMVDGSMITSRSQHRSHLKQYGMIEIGNETNHLTRQRTMADVQIDRKSAERRKETVAALVDKHRR